MTANNSPRLGVWLFLTIGLFCLLQILTKTPPEDRKPGTDRGDLVLRKGVLPEQIDEWKCVGFNPAAPPSELPDGQFWWTHSWLYHRLGLSAPAYVAFDQADWDGWHELTVCYQAGGWTLADRTVVAVDTIEWPVVVAKLTRLSGEKATLVFSLFDQDGRQVPSPFTGIPPKKINRADKPFLKGLADRLADQPQTKQTKNPEPSSRTKIMQCQCLLQHQDELSEEMLQHLISLHQESCSQFRSAWMNRQNNRQQAVAQ